MMTEDRGSTWQYKTIFVSHLSHSSIFSAEKRDIFLIKMCCSGVMLSFSR